MASTDNDDRRNLLLGTCNGSIYDLTDDAMPMQHARQVVTTKVACLLRELATNSNIITGLPMTTTTWNSRLSHLHVLKGGVAVI